MPGPLATAGYYTASHNRGELHTPKYHRTVSQPLPRRKAPPSSSLPKPPLKHDPLPSDGQFDPMAASVGYNGQWVTPEHPQMPLLWNAEQFRGSIGTSQGAALANLGNTCFMNAALQALLYCPPVAALLAGEKHCAPKAHSVGKCVLCALQHLASTMLQQSGVVAPSQLRAKLRDICSGFRTGSQEDAHEFVRGLLDAMTRQEVAGCAALRQKVRLSREMELRSNVHRLFGGMLQSCVQCTSCGHRSTSLEPFLDLSLEIERGRGQPAIIPALKKFTAPEPLHGDNQYRCSGCRKMVNANKRMTIRRAPNVLTVHLKRFNWDGKKTQGFVQYPSVLNLGPFMPGRPDSPAPRYRLSSVIVHAGSSRCGHYFAFVLGRDGRWYRKDDAQSKEVPADLVLKQHAYMLLYTRLPTPETKSPADSPHLGVKRPRPSTPPSCPSKPSPTSPTLKPATKKRTLFASMQSAKPSAVEVPTKAAAPPQLQIPAEPRILSEASERGVRWALPPDPAPDGKVEESRPPPSPTKSEKERRKVSSLLIGGSAAVTKILQRVFRLEASISFKRKRFFYDDEISPREPEFKRFRFRRRQK